MIPKFVGDMMDFAQRAGSFPMQVLLLLAIVALGAGVLYLHRENRATIKEWTDRMDQKDAAISAERVTRINMLLALIEEDTKAKVQLTHAITNNNEAIGDLKDFLKNFMQDQLELIKAQNAMLDKILKLRGH